MKIFNQKIFDKENYLNKKGELYNVFTTEGHFYSINQTHKRIKKNDRFGFGSKSKVSIVKSLNQSGDETDWKNSKAIYNEQKKCNLKISPKQYYNMRYNLPMKMSYFDQLFEMVGVDDNLGDAFKL